MQGKIPSGWASANLGIHRRGDGTCFWGQAPSHPHREFCDSGAPDSQHNPDLYLLSNCVTKIAS